MCQKVLASRIQLDSKGSLQWRDVRKDEARGQENWVLGAKLLRETLLHEGKGLIKEPRMENMKKVILFCI